MLIACIFPISEKSGVNVNGMYNTNKATQIEELDSPQALTDSTNFEFYKRIWTLQGYIKNPYKILLLFYDYFLDF